MSLLTPSQSVSHKWFHQCVNHKQKLSLRHPLPTFGSFSYFQTSLSLGVEQGLQKLPKFDINDLRLLFHCFILIPRKCPRKIPFQHTVCVWGGEGTIALPPDFGWNRSKTLSFRKTWFLAPRFLGLPTALHMYDKSFFLEVPRSHSWAEWISAWRSGLLCSLKYIRVSNHIECRGYIWIGIELLIRSSLTVWKGCENVSNDDRSHWS